MALIPVPPSVAHKVSTDAVRFAREAMKGFGWSDRCLQALSPYPGDGMVGIQTSLKFLMYQERGIKPFLMHWVAGRTIAMPCAQGDGPHFRRGSHVGEPGYVNIPHQGQVWRDARWRHPGLPGRNFMAQGIQAAVEQNRPMITAWARSILTGGAK